MMKKEDVIQVLAILADAGIEVIVGGGWAVDTVLGQQTREHQDLDIAILHKDVPALRIRLAENGFGEIPVDDSWMCNFLLEDAQGRRVDVHSCTFDEKRRNIFGVKYPIESWQGSDEIAGVQVKCVPAEWLVEFHTGYSLDQQDYLDVKALCDHFGFHLPEEYREFTQSAGNYSENRS